MEFDRDAAALDMLPAGGRAAAMPMHPPVETLAAAGPVPLGSPTTAAAAQRPPPLAAGWQPPAVAPPPPPSAAPQPGWQPPASPGAANGGGGQGGSRLAKIYSGAFMVRRGAGADPGFTDLPSASEQGSGAGGGDGLGWKPPAPEDFNSKGRSFKQHVDATANWRHHRVHGTPAASDASASGGVAPAEDEFVTFPQRAELPDAGAGGQAPAAGGQQRPPGHAASGASVNGPLAPTGASWDRILPGVGTAPSSGGSTPGMSERHASYADATQAAEAARRFSAMAAQAAQRAEEFAANQSGTGPSRLGPGATASSPGSAAGSPRDGGDDGGNTGGGSPTSGSGSQRFVQRSDSDIKRSYDAAPGPPAKPQAPSSGPPSAPPAPTGAGTLPADAPPASSAADAELDLPSVPTGGQGRPPPVQDELDELTRRFEALKRR